MFFKNNWERNCEHERRDPIRYDIFKNITWRTLHEIVWKEVRKYLNENEIENAILNSVNFVNGE